MTTIAIATHCRDYLEALRQTLPAFLKQTIPDDLHFAGVVVVDFGSPESRVSELVNQIRLRDGHPYYSTFLTAIRVEGEFHPCRSRNIGINRAIEIHQADWVLWISCDMLPNDDDSLAKMAALRNNGAVMFPLSEDPPGWCETALLNTDTFRAIRGYDESHTGYGHDDSNYYLRLQHHRFATAYGPKCFTHLDHPRHIPEGVDLGAQWAWAADMSRPCNPRGYGK